MPIVTQTDKRTGITYAYDTTYYWDKEKQQSRSKRVCVGKVGPETGDIVPTRGRAKKGSESTSGKPAKTVKHLLEDLGILGFGKTKFVMGRGFYSEDNINGLYRDHIKFLVGTKLSLKFIRKHLDEVYDDIRMFVNFDESINTYGYTVSAQWEYTQ